MLNFENELNDEVFEDFDDFVVVSSTNVTASRPYVRGSPTNSEWVRVFTVQPDGSDDFDTAQNVYSLLNLKAHISGNSHRKQKKL